MCCLVEFGLLIAGIVIMVMGRIQFSRNRVVEGIPARIIGLVLLIPLPLALSVGLVVGAGLASQGQKVDAENMIYLSLIDVVLIFLCLLIAGIIGLVTAKPPRRKRRRSRYDEDDFTEDSRGRRRRYDEDDDDDEESRSRPGRRRRDDDEDDDPPPRRFREPRPPEDEDEPPRRPPDDRFRP